MNKYIIIGIIGIFLISGINATASIDRNNEIYQLHESFTISPPFITTDITTTKIELIESDGYINIPDAYRLPFIGKTFVLPFGSRICDIQVSYGDMHGIELTKPIEHASPPIVDSYPPTHNIPEYAFPQSEYNSIFPSENFQSQVVTGRYDGILGTCVNFQLYPIRYNIPQNKLMYFSEINIQILYETVTNQQSYSDSFDLLIIAPDEYTTNIQPLVDHKEVYGISTKLVTLPEIYGSSYFPVEGRDCAEEVKYFIKSALDEWGITYVLLIGGRKGGILQESWWVPVRYSHVDDGGEGSYLTDLYFADVYDASMNFSSWDSNENDIFAEWTSENKDILDMFPEVYIGRLACRNTYEVKTMVDKIIEYETNAFGSEWSTKFVGIAGDTYPDEGDPYFEGELATEGSFNHLDNFTSSYLWTSLDTFTNKKDIIDEINDGCGFIHFSGHGNPAVWGNHPPYSKKFIYGPNNFEAGLLRNRGKYPIIAVGGCHNAQFNVSLLNIVKGVIEEGLNYFNTSNPVGSFWHDEWIPRCWSWSLINRRGGGGIAVMANTGLGYGASGSDWDQRRGRVMEMLFYEKYSDGYTMLGATHGQEIMAYMALFPPMDDLIDCKIAQQWVLLGDPSLQIGGYDS